MWIARAKFWLSYHNDTDKNREPKGKKRLERENYEFIILTFLF